MEDFLSQKGITLIEVLAAMLILSIILISFFGFFSQMGKMNKQNIDKTQAVNSAKQILNDWKTNTNVKYSVEFPATPKWPISPTPSAENYYLFNLSNPEAEIRIWKQPESGIASNDTIKAFKIQVIIKNERNIKITETFGYIITK